MAEELYRGQAAFGFGLWRKNHHGHWLFCLPVEGAKWVRTVEAPNPENLVRLVDDVPRNR